MESYLFEVIWASAMSNINICGRLGTFLFLRMSVSSPMRLENWTWLLQFRKPDLVNVTIHKCELWSNTLYWTTESGGRNENHIRKSGANFHISSYFNQETKFSVNIVLLLLYFYLFAEPVTAMPVLYALRLSEIASNLALLQYFERLN